MVSAGRAGRGTIRTVPDVLLVTDADSVADQCEAALGGRHLIRRIRRGADAIETVKEVDPDLVVLDLQIGNMGGMAVCMAIRQSEGMGRLGPRPVMMLLDRPADEFLARRSQADIWLVKPVDPVRLLRMVEATLRTGSDQASDQDQDPVLEPGARTGR